MSFNTALSGIRAANADLSVTGNNIANAGTVGFKSSRAEFADLYSASILGSGGNVAGSGVSLEMIRQNFDNGNRKITERDLDLAVNGSGFFVMNKDGDQLFTRAGSFSLDKEGNVISSPGTYLQGYAANAAGNIGGILGNLRIDVTTQAPRQTTNVSAAYNLDANEPVLESVGTQFSSDTGAVGVSQRNLLQATQSRMDLGSVDPIIGFVAEPTIFDLELGGGTGAGYGGPATITINTDPAGNTLPDLADHINSAIRSATPALSVQAVVVGSNLELQDINSGVASTISVTNVTGNNPLATALGTPVGFVSGIPAVTNGYTPQTLEIAGPNGASVTYTSARGATAAQTASELNALAGVSATARTEAQILSSFNLTDPNYRLTLNGVTLINQNLSEIEDEINSLTTSTLPGISATYNEATGHLDLVSAVGTDINLSIAYVGPAYTGSVPATISLPLGTCVELQGRAGTKQVLDAGNNEDLSQALVVGGSITVVMDEGFSISEGDGNLFLIPLNETDVVINAFDPLNQDTYNHATSLPVFDSLGNPHVMTQFFVKQNYDPTDASTSPNHWKMYVQIDGENVGDPDYTLLPPENTAPTMASFNVHFSPDGTLNRSLSDKMLISNWQPRGTDGEIIGALGPLNVLQGGTLPVVEPPTSSNFEIDLTDTTQFGNVFSVEDRDQNGYSTGRLSGLDVGADGIIFARFTNGETQVLGQVALANFNNVDGLKPVGGTMWAQTFETGEAIIGAPGSASLGVINAGSLEESNVDLSEQLVNLIIAQRNFQANAKTIETANATTQTIINLR